MSAPELKPCPFCGCDAIEPWQDGAWSGRWQWLYCTECHAHGPNILSREDADEDVRDAWNTRATSEADELRAENERLRDGLKDIAALRVITASDMAVNILKGDGQ